MRAPVSLRTVTLHRNTVGLEVESGAYRFSGAEAGRSYLVLRYRAPENGDARAKWQPETPESQAISGWVVSGAGLDTLQIDPLGEHERLHVSLLCPVLVSDSRTAYEAPCFASTATGMAGSERVAVARVGCTVPPQPPDGSIQAYRLSLRAEGPGARRSARPPRRARRSTGRRLLVRSRVAQ